MVNTYITPFIEQYGLRDGIILSELCKKEFESWKNGIGFSRQDCERVLDFLTGKQIRSGIDDLIKSGCIERMMPEASFDRTAKYRIRPEVYNRYMKTLLAVKAAGAE